MECFMNLCVILVQGYTNLLCIVPNFSIFANEVNTMYGFFKNYYEKNYYEKFKQI